MARSEGLGPEDALDCVQEAICALLERERRGELPSGGDGWVPILAAMVRNTARNHRRRHHHSKPHASLDLIGDAEVDPPPAADEVVARAEDVVRLRACVAELCGV